MPGSILFVGDLHLGRRPSRLPENLAEYGIRPEALGPAAAWRRAVRTAIESGVDAVVLAGDVVEAENRLYESLGPLDAGVRELLAAGVRVLAVSGNHDGEALPRLAAAIDGFRLLGPGGTWETTSLGPRGAGESGAPFARLVGWSFPASRYPENPLISFPALPPVGVPTLGVLHADVDQPGSPYAPVARADLAATGLAGWFLGHVHAPSPLDGDPPLGYLGSLTGLDPGEPGERGPVRVDVDAAGRVKVRRLGGAPLRWERLELRLDDPSAPLRSADELPARLTRALEDLHDSLADEADGRLALGVRVTLRGRSPAHRDLREIRNGELADGLRLVRDGVLIFLEKLIDEGRPAIDLEAIARGPTPPGRLARHLLALEGGGPAAEELLRDARLALEPVADDRAWSGIPPARLDREALRTRLLDAGYEALEELLAQAPGAPDGEPAGAR